MWPMNCSLLSTWGLYKLWRGFTADGVTSSILFKTVLTSTPTIFSFLLIFSQLDQKSRKITGLIWVGGLGACLKYHCLWLSFLLSFFLFLHLAYRSPQLTNFHNLYITRMCGKAQLDGRPAVELIKMQVPVLLFSSYGPKYTCITQQAETCIGATSICLQPSAHWLLTALLTCLQQRVVASQARGIQYNTTIQ